MDEQQPTAPAEAPQEPAAQSPQGSGKISAKSSWVKTFAYYLVAAVVIYFLVWFFWLK